MMQSGALDEFKRGWRTLLACSVGNGSGLSGIAYYTIGIFVVPLVAAFGWKRGETSIAASFLIVGTAITAPIIGSIIDKFGARRVALFSMLAISIGYAGLTQLGGQIAFFYAAWLLISLAGGGTTPVVWTRTVNIWFDKGRGLALGLALAGSGVAGVASPVLTAMVIQKYGWEAGYIALGLFIFFVSLPLLFIFFKDHKPGESHDAPPTVGSELLPGMSLDEARKEVAFWKIAVGFFLVAGVISAMMINLVPLLIDRGVPQVEAAGIASIMGIAVLGGRVGIGFLLDRFHAPKVARTLLCLSGLGCFLLSLNNTPEWVVAISVLSLGFAAAAEVDLVAYLSSRYFGMKSYGKIYGWQLSSFYAGAALGPLCAGLAYDAFQSYLPMVYFAVACLVFGGIVIGTMGKAPSFGRSGH
ncbi:MAG: MFS transporter [Rhodospirillaceae bacterium]|nr:MFS transporter [Rhodospirillaceae bacterium]